MVLDNDHYLTVTDLKQFTHCKRVTYYEHCLPHLRPRTYKMDAGRDVHEEEQVRAKRRTLRQYDVDEGRREFDLAVVSSRLGLRGEIDEVVYTTSGEIFPIDYKLAKAVGSHHRLQLAAYAILLEEMEQISVAHGFVYLIPKRQTVKVKLTNELRQTVEATVQEIREIITLERMPEPAPSYNYCVACEFRRFCNDVAP